MNDLEVIKKKAEYCLNCTTRPCTKGCPLENNIPDFIKCIKEEDYKGAYNVLLKTTVLQPICGRICPHEKQCQGKCVRGIKGEAVSIGDLEAFIGDMAIKEGYSIENDYKINEILPGNVKETCYDELKDNKKTDKKVAVVGSGPAGITCAAFLARKGYKVTIYEKYDKLGGLLRHGIPEFRLNRELLDVQIQKILDIGIEVIYNKEMGKDYSLDDLREKYDAVFLGFGANISRKVNVPGEELDGVFGGNELLEKNIHPNYKDKKVAVIGGGNVAMDVCRTVHYMGANKVYVIYRRAEEQMPAEKKEIEEAKKEGIEFLFQTNIVRINGGDCKREKNQGFSDDYGVNDEIQVNKCVSSVECIKTKLVKKDEDRLVPINIKGSNYVLDVDYVMMAVGAEAENSIVSGLGLEIDKRGYVIVNEDFETSVPGVFAGGDLIGTKSTVAWAAKNGRDAAYAIFRYLE